jgi:hypothetical protein
MYSFPLLGELVRLSPEIYSPPAVYKALFQFHEYNLETTDCRDFMCDNYK